MEKYQEILKSLDLLLEDLSPEQIERLKKLSETVTNPVQMDATEAVRIVNELGIDIDALQKKARRLLAENKKLKTAGRPKIGANEKCPCNSGKKYKKCCRKI